MIAAVCLTGGVLCQWRLRTLQKEQATTRATVLMRLGDTRPMYLYAFEVNAQRFQGTAVGPDRPLYDKGDLIPVSYLSSDPRLSNVGNSLTPFPLENPEGWFICSAIAALHGLYFGAIAKSAPKEYPWS